MEVISTLDETNEIKKNTFKKNKQKYSLLKEKFDPDISKSIKKKKKAKKISAKLNSDQRNNKYLEYKNTNYYTSVIADPVSLQPTPQIFQRSILTDSCNSHFDPSLLSFLPLNSFNSNISQRFNHLALFNKNFGNSISAKELETSHKNKGEKEGSNEGRENLKNVDLKVDLKKSKSLLNRQQSNLNQIKFYKVKENEGLIIHMHHKSSFSFHGEIKITLLCGEIEILGYTLSHLSEKNSVDVYSPNFYTGLVIETKPPKENKLKSKMESILLDYISEVEVKSILTNFNTNDAVLLVKQINSVCGIIVNKYWDYPLFPKDLEDVESECHTVKSVQSVFDLKLLPEGKHFKKNPQWDNIPLGSCTVICGGKTVGKSVLLKYYMNKLLTHGEKVLCLDFDIGQPEFTAPGCVSAVIVDQPLLGPNFTHVIDPALMMYVGEIDVAQNPSRYLECVKYIIDSCRKNIEFCRMKWFVNTMGFSKGLGVYLMITILKLLQPNTVIQIQGSYKNNYPFFLTQTNINSKVGFKSASLADVKVSHDLHIVESYAGKNEFGKKGELSQGSLKPRQLRDIMSLSYFSRAVSSPYYNFNAVQPYLISFSEVYLGIHSLIDFNDILKAFNANIVSLMKFEPDVEEVYSVDSDEDDYFRIVVKPKVNPCLGLGLVRGIDCSEKKFYILTHLPSEILNEVNCFCLEKINPPHSMFLKQETVEGRNVYTTVGSINVIQRVKRIFHGSTTT